jgi:hypothetical protein
MPPLAHTGHTLVTIGYFVPVLAFLLWLAIVQVRMRLRGERPDERRK